MGKLFPYFLLIGGGIGVIALVSSKKKKADVELPEERPNFVHGEAEHFENGLIVAYGPGVHSDDVQAYVNRMTVDAVQNPTLMFELLPVEAAGVTITVIAAGEDKMVYTLAGPEDFDESYPLALSDAILG